MKRSSSSTSPEEQRMLDEINERERSRQIRLFEEHKERFPDHSYVEFLSYTIQDKDGITKDQQRLVFRDTDEDTESDTSEESKKVASKIPTIKINRRRTGMNVCKDMPMKDCSGNSGKMMGCKWETEDFRQREYMRKSRESFERKMREKMSRNNFDPRCTQIKTRVSHTGSKRSNGNKDYFRGDLSQQAKDDYSREKVISAMWGDIPEEEKRLVFSNEDTPTIYMEEKRKGGALGEVCKDMIEKDCSGNSGKIMGCKWDSSLRTPKCKQKKLASHVGSKKKLAVAARLTKSGVSQSVKDEYLVAHPMVQKKSKRRTTPEILLGERNEESKTNSSKKPRKKKSVPVGCHSWTKEEMVVLKKKKKRVAAQKEVCEEGYNVWTHGIDNPENCGECWCCEPDPNEPPPQLTNDQRVSRRKAPKSHDESMMGGGWSYIVNPETGRKVNINGKIGQRVLMNYVNML